MKLGVSRRTCLVAVATTVLVVVALLGSSIDEGIAEALSPQDLERAMMRATWRDFQLLVSSNLSRPLSAEELAPFVVLADELPDRPKQLNWSYYPRWRLADERGCNQWYCLRITGPVRHVPFNVPHHQLPTHRPFPWMINSTRGESIRLYNLILQWKLKGAQRSRELDKYVGKQGEVLRTEDDAKYNTEGVVLECRAFRQVHRLFDALPATTFEITNTSQDSYHEKEDGNEASVATAPRRKKALIVYVVGTESSMGPVERDNFNFFLDFGIVPFGVDTAVFSGVDYIFVLQRNSIHNPILLLNQSGNVFWYETPQYHCDLSTHAMLLDTFTRDRKVNISREYGSVIMLNRGVRGPFMSANESAGTWLDVIGFHNINRTIVSIAISYQIQIHIQSYFAAIPGHVAQLWRNFYLTGARSMKDCMFRTETHTLFEANRLGLGAYSLTQGAFAPPFRKKTLGTGPLKYPFDPCTSIFVKIGGTAYKELDISLAFEQSVARLTEWQYRMRRGRRNAEPPTPEHV